MNDVSDRRPYFELSGEFSKYNPPEYFGDMMCEYSADYWGLGLLIYQMTTGILPFSDEESIVNNEFPSLDKFHISSECKEFIANLLEKDKYKRLGSRKNPNKARNHSFFREIDWEKLEKAEIKAPFIPNLVVILFIYFAHVL